MAQKPIIIPGERYQTKIIIHTRKRTEIDNVQEYELTPFYLQQVKEFNKRYAERATFVNEASPIYNCHGLTFGSRRSAIWDSKEVAKILDEDDYKEINENEVHAGDIIVYYDHQGDMTHSGLVIGEKEGLPLVLSKWGYGREAVHQFNNSPYFENCPIVKYFRISK